ncbi:ATP-binding protein [Paraburkholderia mimosarum]|uniref:ATP-binding protein n=1 Tax=Paraburkholderia mimosarum TaxID=312026 RepID=UPI0006840E0E|nr:ATP-binding protein [Paraburkholderia mimosarum]
MNKRLSLEEARLHARAVRGSPDDKFEYLRSLRFTHPNLEAVRKQVRQNTTPHSELSITIVTGPAGVGKSTFANLLMEELLKIYEVEIKEDPGSIPVVYNEIDAADGKLINWQLFYKNLLQDLLTIVPEPLLNKGSSAQSTNTAIKNSRMLLDDALRNRKVRYIILDEVVHLTDSRTPPLQYGNLLKSLANRAGLNLILVGAYGSERLMEASGQLTRRVDVVHYARYRSTKKDFAAFATFLKEFQNFIPLPFEIPLSKYIEPLFRAHVGLSGYASQTIAKAVRTCAYEGANRWHDDYMWSAFPAPAAHEKIALETMAGEKAVERYLKSPGEKAYPSEAEMLARLTAGQTKGGSRSSHEGNQR